MSDVQSAKRIRRVYLLVIVTVLASVLAPMAILFLTTILFIGAMAWQQANSDFSQAAFDRLQAGATESQVLQSLGEPNSRSTAGMPAGSECWTYWEPGLVPDPMYLVTFQDGVVTSTEIDDF